MNSPWTWADLRQSGDGQHRSAGRGGRGCSLRGVLDGQAISNTDTEALSGKKIRVRGRFSRLRDDIIEGYDSVERVTDPLSHGLQYRLDNSMSRPGDDPHRDTGLADLGEEVQDAGAPRHITFPIELRHHGDELTPDVVDGN